MGVPTHSSVARTREQCPPKLAKTSNDSRHERSSRTSPIVSAASTPLSSDKKRRSLPIAAKRDGGGVGLPGTGSPRKILALERCRQHEIAAYQRWISADGSRLFAAHLYRFKRERRRRRGSVVCLVCFRKRARN